MAGGKGHRLDSLKTERASAGLSITELARKSNTSDWLVRQLETGATCDGHEAQRIADALGVSLVTLWKKDL